MDDILNTKIKSILAEKNTTIKPSNIREGTSILGVSGNVVELRGETKTITPTTSQQTITPSQGKNGITQAIVVAVTSSIDGNITAENIKKDVNILGITGTYEGATSTNNAKILPRSGNYFGIYTFIEEIDDGYDISAVTSIKSLFTGLYSLKKAPSMNTSHIENAQNLFSTCESLITVPVYDFSGMTNDNHYNMFNGCRSLSNDSLNNILQTCIGMTGVTTKTLKQMGISSTQATTCQSLSNWSAFTSAGWTTGY